MATRPASPHHDPSPKAQVPLAIWPVAQSTEHEALTVCPSRVRPLPATLAARIIETYTEPGQLVVDPDDSLGSFADQHEPIGRRVVGCAPDDPTGPRHLLEALGEQAGQVDLAVVAPPRPTDRSTVVPLYATCSAVLRPGGRLVTVTRTTRRKGRCRDVAGATVAMAREAGFTYVQHVVALLAAIRDDELVALPSAWQGARIRRARDNGDPVHLVVHLDVLVFTKPTEEVR